MDPFLLPYLEATHEPERQEWLDEIVRLQAAPAIRHTLRQKLGFYVDHQGSNRYNPDAEDLYQEAMAKVVEILNDLRNSPEKYEIQHFRQYCSRVAATVCMNSLRAKSPARRRLKDKLRYLLSSHSDFALWKAQGEYLCGFANWRANKPLSSQRQTQHIDEMIADFRTTSSSNEDITPTALAGMVNHLLQRIGTPVELNTLVNTLATILNVKDDASVLIDPLLEHRPSAETVLSINSRVEARELLTRLWHEVKQLPMKQRDAFCLSFQDESGRDLFSCLREAGVVTFPQLAQALGRSTREISHLRSQMPMDSKTLAVQLNVSRGQVNKLRVFALRRLKKALLSQAFRVLETAG